MILNLVEGREWLDAVVDALANAARRRYELIACAQPQDLAMKGGIAQMRLIGLAGYDRVAFHQLRFRPVAQCTDHRNDEVLLEILCIAGQTILGQELHEYRVVAFEGGEYVHVPTDNRNLIFAEKTQTAAAFACHLASMDGMPRSHRLDARGQGFNLTRGFRRALLELLDQVFDRE